MQITVDGFVASPEGQLDWMTRDQDKELKKFTVDLTDTCDTILLGRKMTEGFTTYWEDVLKNQPNHPDFYLADKMVSYHKVAFSKTLKSVTGKNTVVENGDLATAVNKLKDQPGKDIVVYGGAGFVSSLIKARLIDEFYLFVNPCAISKGMTIFGTLESKQKFTLVKSTPYTCGVIVQYYKPNND